MSLLRLQAPLVRTDAHPVKPAFQWPRYRCWHTRPPHSHHHYRAASTPRPFHGRHWSRSKPRFVDDDLMFAKDTMKINPRKHPDAPSANSDESLTLTLDQITLIESQPSVTALLSLFDSAVATVNIPLIQGVVTRLMNKHTGTLVPQQYVYVIYTANDRTDLTLKSRILIDLYTVMRSLHPADASHHTVVRMMLPILSKHRQYEMIVELYTALRRYHQPVDSIMLGIVLHACGNIRDSKRALEIYRRYRDDRSMALHSWQQSIHYTTTRINPKSRTAGDTRAVVNVSMSPLTPFNLIHFTHVVFALYNTDDVCHLPSIVKDLHRYHIQPDLFFYTTALYSLSSRALWSDCYEMLYDMRARAVEPDEFCYYYCMLACAYDRQWRRALELMKECQSLALPIIPPLYEAALIAAEFAQQIEVTKLIVESMRTDNVTMSYKAYHSLVRQARRIEDWHWLLNLYKLVKKELKYHRNAYVNDCVLLAVHEIQAQRSTTDTSNSNDSADPFYMTVKDLYEKYFARDGILGPLGWWMLAKPHIDRMRDTGDSQHTKQSTKFFQWYCLQCTIPIVDGNVRNRIGKLPLRVIGEIASAPLTQYRQPKTVRVYELSVAYDRIDESFAALDLLLSMTYYHSQLNNPMSYWFHGFDKHVTKLPCHRDKLVIVCNVSVNEWDSDSVLAPNEIDKVISVSDVSTVIDASDNVTEALSDTVYRAWTVMKKMFGKSPRPAPALQPLQVELPATASEPMNGSINGSHGSHSEDDHLNDSEETDINGTTASEEPSDPIAAFRTSVAAHLQSEYGICAEFLDRDSRSLLVSTKELQAWVLRERRERTERRAPIVRAAKWKRAQKKDDKKKHSESKAIEQNQCE